MRAASVAALLFLVFSPPSPALAQAPPTMSTFSGSSQSSSGTQSSSSTQGPTRSIFLGGVPSGPPTQTVLTLTLVDAMGRALEHNLGVLTSQEQIGRAEGTRWKELSALLPNINGRISDVRQKINLAAYGFGSLGTAFSGISPIVGPYNVFDARLYASQAILDLKALNSARSEAHNVEAARYTNQSARDFVVWVAANVYLQALAASARVESAQAQQQTAQTLYNQAVDLRQSGIVAGIDVLRAEVQLDLETNRATSAVNDFEKLKLQLAQLIGLPIGQPYRLDSTLPELQTPDLSIDAAVQRAYETRADYRAALERVKAAEDARRSVIGEALPAIHLNADVGEIGLSPGDARSTFSVAGAVQIPIFQGRKTHGRLLEADADLRSRQTEVESLKASIYYEVRSAFLDLQTTNSQLQVATKARDLASQQLTQARDRFAAGVASNVEVVQAQAVVALANEQYIAALYGYDLAKGALIRGIGTAEQQLRQYLGGSR